MFNSHADVPPTADPASVQGALLALPEEEDELVRKLTVAEVAQQTGRSRQAVYDRRHELHLPDGRRRRAVTLGSRSAAAS